MSETQLKNLIKNVTDYCKYNKTNYDNTTNYIIYEKVLSVCL